jgi:hypothetical protein
MGQQFAAKGEEVVSGVAMINSETDMKIFIDENRSFTPLNSKAQFEAYAPEPKN